MHQITNMLGTLQCIGLLVALIVSGCADTSPALRTEPRTAALSDQMDRPSVRQPSKAEGQPAMPTGQVQLAWEAPTTNQDGTPLTDLAGYKLYYGLTSQQYTSNVDVGNRTSYTLAGLEVGRTYYFALTAYDISGNESALTPELRTTIAPGRASTPVPPPATPATRALAPVLDQTPFVRGQEVRFQVDGITPGDVVFFLFSLTGPGDGPCAAELGGLCVDLRAPQVFGQVTADASGTAVLSFVIPEHTRAGQDVSVQAVIRRGLDGMHSVKTNAITSTVK
jgi:hypothetical protein